ATQPLPDVVAGLSAVVAQGQFSVSVPAPILSVHQEKECSRPDAFQVCLLTAIRLQMPFELHAPSIKPGPGGGGKLWEAADVVITIDGQSTRGFPLRIVPDNAHVLTSCDLVWDTNSDSVCSRVVFHQNGAMVDSNAPVDLGETVLVYAFGLGQTIPAATTGAP